MYFRYVLGILLLWANFSAVQACDACGCSIMFWDLGITPRFQSHRISLGWQHQSFRSFASLAEAELGNIGSEEQFQQLNLQAQVRLHERWRLNIALPYSILQRQLPDQDWQLSGWADPSILLTYMLINQEQKASTSWRHRWSVGLGAKLPFGPQQQLPDDLQNQANFRLGTGSTDWLLYSQYVLRYQDWGLSADALLSLNGTNNEEYRYGHRSSGNLTFFGVFSAGKIGIMPRAGLYYEGAGADVQRGFYRDHTGGHYLFGQLGVQTFWPGFSAELRYLPVLHQNWADGLTQAQNRWALQLNYFL
ncbi:MAG: hypothetical protein AAFO03_13075 [Bacteroidota bacterium]